MTETTLHGGFTGEAFAAFLQSRAEPAWLADLRREAWKIFGELPLPERRSEEWIRTDIRGFRLEQFALPMTHGEAISPPPPLPEPDADGDSAGFAVSVNSSAYRSSLEPSWAARGVLFGSLEQMAVEHGELLRPILQRPIIPVGYDKFAALQAACWSGGTLLYVPKGVVVDQPFRILSAMLAGGVDLGRCLVVLEDGAEATLLTGTDGPDAAAPGLHCGSVELILGAVRGCVASPCRTGAAACGISPMKRPSSGATPRCNGPSPPWEAAWPRSTSGSPWPAKGPTPRSKASSSPTPGSTSPITPSSTTRRPAAPATCSTRRPCTAPPAACGGE